MFEKRMATCCDLYDCDDLIAEAKVRIFKEEAPQTLVSVAMEAIRLLEEKKESITASEINAFLQLGPDAIDNLEEDPFDDGESEFYEYPFFPGREDVPPVFQGSKGATLWVRYGGYEFEVNEIGGYTGWHRCVGGRLADGTWPAWYHNGQEKASA
jgi:hypothetical protein